MLFKDRTPFRLSCAGDGPEITPFLPPAWKRNGKVLLVLPGGGYAGWADHEGDAYSEFFSEHGFTCFTVKYRLGKAGHPWPAPYLDAADAVRLVRSEAENLGIDPKEIGVAGSSAGGHLAAMLGTFRGEGSRGAKPDWMVLCYPVITFEDPYTSYWTRRYFCGTDAPPREMIDRFSCEKNVPADAPPTFLWHNLDDTVVPAENTLLFASALRKRNLPFELHLYGRGGHGCGLFHGHPWTEEALRWMNTAAKHAPGEEGK